MRRGLPYENHKEDKMKKVNIAVFASGRGTNFIAIARAVKKGMVKGLANMGPWGWFFVTLFLWIVGFPAYLAMRGKYKKINEQKLV